jgi:YfiH family protein
MTPPLSQICCITPDWPAPVRVHAYTTTRAGGVSQPPFDTLNLGGHAGDDFQAVAENRRRLAPALGLPGKPRWLRQIHGDRVVELDGKAPVGGADAAISRRPGEVCVVTTADCLPVLLSNRAGTTVAAVHAGWRGLAAGIVKAAVAALDEPPNAILVWLGPAIGPSAYQVGDTVREAFLAADAGAGVAFTASAGAWLCDLYTLARRQLAACGVTAIYGGGFCTYSENARFFSYRRDGRCGRMASLIWIEERGSGFGVREKKKTQNRRPA